MWRTVREAQHHYYRHHHLFPLVSLLNGSVMALPVPRPLSLRPARSFARSWAERGSVSEQSKARQRTSNSRRVFYLIYDIIAPLLVSS